MGIVTARAFFTGVMLIRVNTFDFRSFTCGIRKTGMAPETEFPGSVYSEFHWVCRVLENRSMAVFAFYDFVGGREDLFLLVGMTVLTVFFAVVFNFNGLPLLHVPRPVPSEHIPSLMDAEISGDHEGPGD